MTSQTTKTLDTRNPDWGFFGTVSRDETNGQCADAAWNPAFAAIAAETGCAETGVRDFLDSRQGRHFADTVLDGWLTAGDMHAGIATAIAKWQAWTISRATEKEAGIPRGMAYLTGFVTHNEILAESEETAAA